ncbi:MAG: hypothetical protein ACK5TK_11920 [Betaproteobacteria bacterium]
MLIASFGIGLSAESRKAKSIFTGLLTAGCGVATVADKAAPWTTNVDEPDRVPVRAVTVTARLALLNNRTVAAALPLAPVVSDPGEIDTDGSAARVTTDPLTACPVEVVAVTVTVTGVVVPFWTVVRSSVTTRFEAVLPAAGGVTTPGASPPPQPTTAAAKTTAPKTKKNLPRPRNMIPPRFSMISLIRLTVPAQRKFPTAPPPSPARPRSAA